ncbi:hypothetical protein HDU86_001744 [Geranomyces michiganensis]|nr:hypothetical protein HDU86_001744 [Geranomyces michiganensis]
MSANSVPLPPPTTPSHIPPPPGGARAAGSQPHPSALVTQTYAAIQLSNTNVALFGGLTAFSFVIMVSAALAYRRRRKLIYLLNVVQTLLLFTKTFSATIYAVFIAGQVNCRARAWLLNIPLVLSWDAVYAITLIKVLLFTAFHRTVCVVIPLGAAVHFGLVVTGVVRRTSSISAVGQCTDKYEVFYKHQYDVELIIEIFATGLLLHGIASRKNGVVAATREVFRQLQFNENTRVFLALIFVALKVLLTYGNFAVPSATTHAVDSARSAVVSWALTREVASSSNTDKHSNNLAASAQAQAQLRDSKASRGRESLAAKPKMTVELSSSKSRTASTALNRSQLAAEKMTPGGFNAGNANDDDDHDDGEDDDDDDRALNTEGGLSFGNMPGFDFHGDIRGSVEVADSRGGSAGTPIAGDAMTAPGAQSSSDLV